MIGKEKECSGGQMEPEEVDIASDGLAEANQTTDIQGKIV